MPRPAVHSGTVVAEQLQTIDVSVTSFATLLKIPRSRLARVLNGQRAITGDTALRLGHFFGTNPEFWLNLQKMYELRIAEQEIGAEIKSLPRLRRSVA